MCDCQDCKYSKRIEELVSKPKLSDEERLELEKVTDRLLENLKSKEIIYEQK